jgi:hypothetical protein
LKYERFSAKHIASERNKTASVVPKRLSIGKVPVPEGVFIYDLSLAFEADYHSKASFIE